MDTGTIIAIVVVALLLIALFAFVLPRMRRTAQVKARERELHDRRQEVAGEHRNVASDREREAEVAEQRARMAQTEAERQRAEARLHQQQADMHESGMADDQLVSDDERDKFAPVLDRDDSPGGGPRMTPAGDTGSRGAGDTDRTEYEQGRVDEREAERGGRFDRQDETTDSPSEPRRL
jgi:FtsZ-interacting cell division protein ZipA